MLRAKWAMGRRTVVAAGLAMLASGPLAATPPQPGPRQVLQTYFRLIDQRQFHAAFHLWELGEDGRNAAGQSEAQFAAGFARTRHVAAVIGPEGDGDGAAGSIYMRLKVRLTAQTDSGRTQRFAGTCTLRKSNVEGGHPDWQIYSAKLVRVG